MSYPKIWKGEVFTQRWYDTRKQDQKKIANIFHETVKVIEIFLFTRIRDDAVQSKHLKFISLTYWPGVYGSCINMLLYY